MTKHEDLLVKVRASNPIPCDVDLPLDMVREVPPLAAVLSRRTNMVTTDTPTPSQGTTPTRRRGALIAAAVAVVAIAIALPAFLIANGSETAQTEPPVTAPVDTTVTPVDDQAVVAAPGTEAAHDLVEAYYAAYNAGDTEAALNLLSPIMREVSPATMTYWIETLGERVDAECIDAQDGSDAIVCRERYTDPLHALSGTEAETEMRYAERNGLLLQVHEDSHFLVPGCQQNRCPGVIVEAAESVVWTYEQVEAGFFTWLEATHPDVAETIGDASRLGYFAADVEATGLALPYLAEFEASGGIEAAAGASMDPDFAGMTVTEAVEVVYMALNSHDAATYEELLGSPPDDPTEWFWAQGRVWNTTCEPVADSTNSLRCSLVIEDEFYTKAGAVFEAVEIWTLTDGGELFSSIESANSSGYWAYYDFEVDYARWMRETHPEVADSVFVNLGFMHNGEAAAIAVAYLDEFLAASDTYPRDADPRNDWHG